MPIPVIDLFAGPGGLGEGFSRSSNADFRIAVSIEKDEMAFDTLRLRAAHRALGRLRSTTAKTWTVWDRTVASASWNVVFDKLRESVDENIREACEVARHEAWNIELGPTNREEISQGIRSRLRALSGRHGLPGNAVLIGGPPCQAYSVVGRSRNRGNDGYLAQNDHRHFLYREYLAVIAEFKPAIFVMENVKGILSSKVHDQQIFHSITADLKRPDLACGRDSRLEYTLFSLPRDSTSLFDPEPADYVVEAETHGVPQARHRVIILGVRNDVVSKCLSVGKLQLMAAPSVHDVIADLPPLRPQLSYRGKGFLWWDSFQSDEFKKAVNTLRAANDNERRAVGNLMERAKSQLGSMRDPGGGTDRVLQSARAMPIPRVLRRWYQDRPLRLLANHESRSHMPSDVVRYLFVSAFGQATGRSPKLEDFPTALLPQHKNVDPLDAGSAIFKDRFRVQLAEHFSTTITSHISKDGHAFIHPDPLQCRSLTVREAARLQTFPDSYVFLGSRTSQYSQVGNAVPPYLAVQIADIVGQVISSANLETVY
jgi:DNA (cytosine-5)-methyltransferase 1